LRHYTDVMNPIMRDNIASWKGKPDFHFFPHIKNVLMEVAARTFIGIEDLSGEEARNLAHTFDELTQGMLGIVRWDSPLMPLCKWRKGKQAMRRMERYLIDQIPARRDSDKKDMFSLICKEKDEDGNYFTDYDIASHISFLLFAAHDTTTSNLCYVMQYLGMDKSIQDKARAESLAQNKPFLDFDDLINMHMLDNIHNEALRMNPSVMIMVRRTIRECEIAGVKVPADTLVNIFPQYTHMMKEHWDNPEKFDPDRFSPERAEHKRHPFQFVPFGGGAHKCIGIHFAGMLMKCFMHQMLLANEWAVPAGYNPKHQIFPMPKQKDDLPLTLMARN
jgi:cytochrome P450